MKKEENHINIDDLLNIDFTKNESSNDIPVPNLEKQIRFLLS